MATSAPAAPSTSAPTQAQPSPVSAPATGTPAAPQTDATPAQSTPRAKPIPARARPELPGVIPDGDDGPSFGLPAETSPSSGTPRPRDASGRFTAGEPSPAPADVVAPGDHTLEPGTEPTPSGKFKFAGEEFASQEAAEQNFRSLRGQFRPLQALARQLGGLDKVGPTLTSAAESARGWKARAEALEAELTRVSSGGQPASPVAQPSSPSDQTAEATPSVDWELYAEVKRLAAESGQPWKAEQWLIEETAKVERARYEQLLNERLAPYEAQQEKAGVAQQTEALFGQLAEYELPDGSPAFPELHDEAAAYEVGRLWASLGLPREAALTPQGAAAAIGLYRMWQRNKANTNPAQATVAPSAPPSPAPPSDAVAAATLADGRVPNLSLPGAGGPSAEAARILAGLKSTNNPSRNTLGFDA